jgi:hypothetical protein
MSIDLNKITEIKYNLQPISRNKVIVRGSIIFLLLSLFVGISLQIKGKTIEGYATNPRSTYNIKVKEWFPTEKKRASSVPSEGEYFRNIEVTRRYRSDGKRRYDYIAEKSQTVLELNDQHQKWGQLAPIPDLKGYQTDKTFTTYPEYQCFIDIKSNRNIYHDVKVDCIDFRLSLPNFGVKAKHSQFRGIFNLEVTNEN